MAQRKEEIEGIMPDDKSPNPGIFVNSAGPSQCQDYGRHLPGAGPGVLTDGSRSLKSNVNDDEEEVGYDEDQVQTLIIAKPSPYPRRPVVLSHIPTTFLLSRVHLHLSIVSQNLGSYSGLSRKMSNVHRSSIDTICAP